MGRWVSPFSGMTPLGPFPITQGDVADQGGTNITVAADLLQYQG